MLNNLILGIDLQERYINLLLQIHRWVSLVKSRQFVLDAQRWHNRLDKILLRH